MESPKVKRLERKNQRLLDYNTELQQKLEAYEAREAAIAAKEQAVQNMLERCEELERERQKELEALMKVRAEYKDLVHRCAAHLGELKAIGKDAKRARKKLK